MVKNVLYLIVCLAAMLVPLLPQGSAAGPTAVAQFPGWPKEFEGRPLIELEISDRERRFADGFPGRIGRFTNGRSELVVRWIAEETRMLHPASDCYRGIGYDVNPEPALFDETGARWGRFRATNAGESAMIRERIFDHDGNSWSDVSEWYWAAALGRTSGPWWAVTVAEVP